MSTEAFRAILDGIEDAVAFAKGDTTRGRVHPPKIEDVDVAKLRERLQLTQSEFAQGFGVSLGTLRNWEQRRRKPEGPACVLLKVISQDPKHVVSAIWPTREKKALHKRVKAASADHSPPRRAAAR